MSKNPTSTIHLSEPIRVSVIAGDPLARAGLESALSTADEIDLTDTARAEVIILDAGSDPAGPNLDRLPSFDAPVVVLISDRGFTQRALAAGARGVLVRDQLDGNLLAALAAARQGLTVVDHSLAQNAPRPTELSEPLTRRETQVLDLMAGGLSNKLIAAELGISEHTAKFHIGSILDKLDADTRTGAVVAGLRLGLVSL